MSTQERAGQNTGAFGNWLTTYLASLPQYHEFQVYFDHGDTAVDANVLATKGFVGDIVTNLNRLADVDVMVVGPDEKVCLLLEIEERAPSPKKVLGNVFACLLSNRFAFRVKGVQRYYSVTPETKLIVAGFVPMKGHRIQKINEIIFPQIRKIRGLGDGISTEKVDLIFSASIEDTVSKLQAMVESMFPC